MALSNMKVFNDALQTRTAEQLAQMVDKFNEASAGAILLTSEGFAGDYRQRSIWSSLAAAQRRVDRYNTNASQNATALAQLEHVGVKVAGGFGPILLEPAQMTWIGKSESEAVEVISEQMALAMMKDQLNTAIAALVGAIEAGTSNTVFDTGTGPLTYVDINTAHAKFGDASGLIVCNVMDGVAYHNLIAQNLGTTYNPLFTAGTVTVVEILGKRVVVTDAPALRETGTGADQKILGLVAGAATVYDGGDLVTNVQTNNGKNRIEQTMQADYSFGLALKGFAWDTTNGGKTPTDAEIATGSNWDKIATSWKHTAGVLAMADV